MALKRTASFVKTTAIGGLLVILPIVVIVYVLGEVLFTLYTISLAIIESEHTPDIVQEHPLVVIITGLGIVLSLCFTTGLIVKTRLGDYLKRSFNKNVVDRIPIIRAIQRVTERFAGIDGEEFAPVEVEAHGEGVALLGILVERLPDGRCAVFVPTSPITTVGNVLIVPPEKMRFLDASIGDTMGAVSQWGVDAARLYAGKPP
jgi:uncharacterized membrane protein